MKRAAPDAVMMERRRDGRVKEGRRWRVMMEMRLGSCRVAMEVELFGMKRKLNGDSCREG